MLTALMPTTSEMTPRPLTLVPQPLSAPAKTPPPGDSGMAIIEPYASEEELSAPHEEMADGPMPVIDLDPV